MGTVRSAPNPSNGQVSGARRLDTPSRLSRVWSHALHEVAGGLLPRRVLLCRGGRKKTPKRLALTFDDGPDAMTRQYLDLLSRQRVRATFFVVGENAERMPGLIDEYVRQGHEVGAHGWTHRPFPSLRPVDLERELARTHAVLVAADGKRRRLVRPPNGLLTASVLLRTAAAGFTTVLWSIDSDDCRTRDPRNVERRLSPHALHCGDIVLLHELQPWTLQALPGAIARLREHGWDFVTVSQLAE